MANATVAASSDGRLWGSVPMGGVYWVCATLGSGSRAGYPASMASPQIIDNEVRAQQLARAIASDIQLYNKAKIEEGLANDTFFELLSEEITEGRDLFRSRVTPELFRRNFFDRAIVDRVIKPSAHLDTKIW